jgi:hypothetical protein
MSVEAMRQALEALELALSNHGVMLLSDPPQDAWKTRQVESKGREAVTALRAALDTPYTDYERGFIDGMQEQMKTSVDQAVNAIDRAVNAMCKREWVGLTDDEWKQIWIEFDSLDVENDFQDYMAGKYGAGHYIDNELYWNFQKGVIEQIVNNKLQQKDGTYKDDK